MQVTGTSVEQLANNKTGLVQSKVDAGGLEVLTGRQLFSSVVVPRHENKQVDLYLCENKTGEDLSINQTTGVVRLRNNLSPSARGVIVFRP